MLFNSMEFLFYFIVVTSLYFLLPHRFRWMLLLFASCYFYMAFVPVYILILGFTIVIDYFAGIFLEEARGRKRKVWLIASLVANIGVLAVFKYYNFLNDNLTTLLHGVGWNNPVPYLKILLPIGLSFHTFQAMSYTIEVYRGHQKAERNFGIYALYVMFYPQLVAGPIERPQNLLHQFYEKHSFDYERVVDGLKIMLWGFVKKLVIADRLGLYVDAVYGNADQHSGLSLIVATVFFAFQIYCDFSGYSDIAIGSAKVMGFTLMRNFNRPYFSANISEFWSRWHISLSTWFKDYLYISLGGNRVSIPRWYFNLFFVFLVSGLWHGANWTFVIWGALNGFYLVAALIRNRLLSKWGWKENDQPSWWMRMINIGITFLLTCFAWIFFRAADLNQATLVIGRIFRFEKGSLFTGNPTFTYSLFAIAFLLLVEAKEEYYKGSFTLIDNKSPLVRYSTYLALILLILLIGVFDGGQFIYFQF
ncbi:MBOAT family O-acyltransferase [Flavihumibacter petaseus]|nr:MBOAT family O-acyltransferase [Flavihumibacter petaseus]